jgi:anti-anti-sigma regulatory factor
MDDPPDLPACSSLFEGNPLALALMSSSAEVISANATWRVLFTRPGAQPATNDHATLLRACETSRATNMRATCEVRVRNGERVVCHVWPADADRLWSSVETPPDQPFELLRELVNRVPINVYACDLHGTCVLSEGGLLIDLGMQPGANVGTNVFATEDLMPMVAMTIRAAFNGETSSTEFRVFDRLLSQMALPRRDADGAIIGAVCIVSDITARRRDEDLLREQVDIIQAQRAAISLLSTPIIEVWTDVLAAPLVGIVDDERAASLMESLLVAIAQKRARFAILDLTGVETIEETSAAHLIRIIRSVTLLGAHAIITGIRPAIAQTMVSLGLDMTAILTLRSLQDALRHCMAIRNTRR